MTTSIDSACPRMAESREVRFIDGAELRRALSPANAVAALEAVLRMGLDPETDAPRARLDTPAGQFLQMPSAWDGALGTKLLTITEGNAAVGSPVVQGLYVLFGGTEQKPLAVLDGIELTNLRTSAVSALGAGLLCTSGPKRLVVFGTGVQAWEHLRSFAEIFDLTEVVLVGRNPAAADALVRRAASELGLAARRGRAAAVAEADLVLCCTASAEPLFEGTLVADGAVVVAIGSHQPDRRELDHALMARSAVVVESRASALREAGDITQALASGALAGPSALHTLADVVRQGHAPVADGPTVFKTTGMPWQDLAIAQAAYAAVLPDADH